MEVQLTPDQAAFVRQAVESGRLQREEDAVKEALSLWVTRERTLAQMQDRPRVQFEKLARQWRDETRFSSSTDEKILHPAYQSIIAMGFSAVPWVLTELEAHRGHWFWALHFMTGANPVPEGSNIDGTRQAWLNWGREKGLLT